MSVDCSVNIVSHRNSCQSQTYEWIRRKKKMCLFKYFFHFDGFCFCFWCNAKAKPEPFWYRKPRSRCGTPSKTALSILVSRYVCFLYSRKKTPNTHLFIHPLIQEWIEEIGAFIWTNNKSLFASPSCMQIIQKPKCGTRMKLINRIMKNIFFSFFLQTEWERRTVIVHKCWFWCWVQNWILSKI